MTRRTEQANEMLRSALQQQAHQDFQAAAHSYRRLLELDPHNKSAWYGLGLTAQQTGQSAEARVAYDKALEIDPSFTSALFSEALLLKSSDPDRAVELLRRAAATDPKAAGVHLQLGRLLAKKGHDDEARDAFRRAVAAEPGLLAQVPERFRAAVSPSPTSSRAGSTR
ncbi:tetratricopeptide repeat protein [Streptomyces sp. NPDC001848]|uniref:tetratricopeptide repeat protein n=1 Tax=Streptomyces sp. NPDC001848 TaxID=3364618 RepID=UPI0036B0F6AC